MRHYTSFRFRLTDPKGLPLDMEGITTPGEVAVRPVLATIPAGKSQYVAYTKRTANSSITGNSAEQADRDRGGSFEKVGDGEYIYTFGTQAPAGYDRTATHTVAVWANRDLEEYELGEPYASDTFNFVPDGSEVSVVRDVVSDESCNKCHGSLTAHDQRSGVALCIT